MKTVHSAGGIVLNDNNEVAIVSQGIVGDVSWSFPKGHVEENEDYLMTAKREIEEETGITELLYIKNLPEYGRHPIGQDGVEDSSSFKIIHLFLFKTPQNELGPKDPENPEARWVPQSEVTTLLSHPKDKDFFQKIRGDLV